MSSGSDVQAGLRWSIACSCQSELCTCGAREDFHAAIRAEVTAHFVSLRLLVFRYLRHLGLRSTDAEDVTQEAFLWLFRSRLEGRRIAHESVRPLVLTVARRRGIDRLRRLRFEQPLFQQLSRSLADTLPDDGRPLDGAELTAQRRQSALTLAIQELSQLQRDCLHFRAAGLSLRETSNIVGVPEKRVSEAIHRGIRRLQRVIDDLPKK